MNKEKQIQKTFDKIFKNNNYMDLNIQNDNIYLRSWNSNTTFFIVNIDYKTIEEYNLICDLIINLFEKFNFNFTLEFYDLKTLKEFKK